MSISGQQKTRVDMNQLFEDTNRAIVDGLKIDLGVALTFTGIALSASGEKRARNRTQARIAYESVRSWIVRVKLTDAETSEINERLATLKSALAELGEPL